MDLTGQKVHTTLNLSKKLINEALKLFAGKNKTEIIHEALDKMVQTEKLGRHFKKWKGKGDFKSYE